MRITARPGELRAFNAALLSQALPAEGLTNPRFTKKTVREGAAILLAAAGYATLAKEVRSGKIADPLEALRFARRGEHRAKAIEVLDRAIVLVAGVPERLRIANPKGRKYGAAPRSKGRIERKVVPQDYWIEPSTDEELAHDPGSPYRMVTTGGQRFALSALDAIRAQKEGLEFRARRNRRRKSRKSGAGKARRNPRESELSRARRTYQHLNETEPGRVTKVRGAKNAPKVAVKLGELVSIVYRSDKYAGSPDNPHGKQQLYEHRTKRPHPVIATDPEGREVHIVGGRMHPTPDGLVN